MSTSRGKRLILEGKVEEYLVKQVELHGGIADKFVTPGRRGPPDRLITWPRAGFCKMELIEVKTLDEYGHPTSLDPLQVQDHKKRAAVGCIVRVIWTKAQVDEYIRYELIRRIPGGMPPMFDTKTIPSTHPALQHTEYRHSEAKPRKFKKRASARIAVAGEEFGASPIRGIGCSCGNYHCAGDC